MKTNKLQITITVSLVGTRLFAFKILRLYVLGIQKCTVELLCQLKPQNFKQTSYLSILFIAPSVGTLVFHEISKDLHYLLA